MSAFWKEFRSLAGNDDHDRSRSMIAIIMMIDDRSMIVFGAGVSWDLFFGAYHFCSIKTVDLATNWCCRHHRRPRRECCQPLTRVLPTLMRVLPTNFFFQKFFCPKFFFLEIVVTRKKIFFGKKIGWQQPCRRECCQPLTRLLPTNWKKNFATIFFACSRAHVVDDAITLPILWNFHILNCLGWMEFCE